MSAAPEVEQRTTPDTAAAYVVVHRSNGARVSCRGHVVACDVCTGRWHVCSSDVGMVLDVARLHLWTIHRIPTQLPARYGASP